MEDDGDGKVDGCLERQVVASERSFSRDGAKLVHQSVLAWERTFPVFGSFVRDIASGSSVELSPQYFWHAPTPSWALKTNQEGTSIHWFADDTSELLNDLPADRANHWRVWPRRHLDRDPGRLPGLGDAAQAPEGCSFEGIATAEVSACRFGLAAP